MKWTLVPWYQMASWTNPNCPRLGGSVARQLPKMATYWLDVSKLYPGTLNISLDCEKIVYPEFAEYEFTIDWRNPEPPTSFKFHKLIVKFNWKEYEGWSYRKIYPEGYISNHPHKPNLLEIVAPKIEGISYWDDVEVFFI